MRIIKKKKKNINYYNFPASIKDENNNLMKIKREGERGIFVSLHQVLMQNCIFNDLIQSFCTEQ